MPVVGVYGGSFDPPHVAHVLAAAYALAVGRFERLLVVPVFQHSFQKRLAPFEHRVRMCELAFADFARVRVSSIEEELPVPSRTLRTLEAIRAREEGVELRLVIGSDVLGDVDKWHAFDEIRRLAPPLVVGRAGHELDDGREPACALPAVSSTQVRTLLERRDEPESRRVLEELVPSAVLDYIVAHGLYAGGLSSKD